jgi:hypothetical protein
MKYDILGDLAWGAGWMFVLTGLTCAGFWVVAPIKDAMIFGTGTVGMLLTIGYCIWLRAQATKA